MIIDLTKSTHFFPIKITHGFAKIYVNEIMRLYDVLISTVSDIGL
jgi:hypothetical protein